MKKFAFLFTLLLAMLLAEPAKAYTDAERIKGEPCSKHEIGFRSKHDQIGRFLSIDVKAEQISGYVKVRNRNPESYYINISIYLTKVKRVYGIGGIGSESIRFDFDDKEFFIEKGTPSKPAELTIPFHHKFTERNLSELEVCKKLRYINVNVSQ